MEKWQFWIIKIYVLCVIVYIGQYLYKEYYCDVKDVRSTLSKYGVAVVKGILNTEEIKDAEKKMIGMFEFLTKDSKAPFVLTITLLFKNLVKFFFLIYLFFNFALKDLSFLMFKINLR